MIRRFVSRNAHYLKAYYLKALSARYRIHDYIHYPINSKEVLIIRDGIFVISQAVNNSLQLKNLLRGSIASAVSGRRFLFFLVLLKPRYAHFEHIAKLSENDCLAISRTPLEPTIGNLRKSLQTAIETKNADSRKTKAILDKGRGSDSIEPDNDLGSQGALLRIVVLF